MERLDDLLKAFISLEIETLIISADFTTGTHRLSGLMVPVLINRGIFPTQISEKMEYLILEV